MQLDLSFVIGLFVGLFFFLFAFNFVLIKKFKVHLFILGGYVT